MVNACRRVKRLQYFFVSVVFLSWLLRGEISPLYTAAEVTTVARNILPNAGSVVRANTEINPICAGGEAPRATDPVTSQTTETNNVKREAGKVDQIMQELNCRPTYHVRRSLSRTSSPVGNFERNERMPLVT